MRVSRRLVGTWDVSFHEVTTQGAFSTVHVGLDLGFDAKRFMIMYGSRLESLDIVVVVFSVSLLISQHSYLILMFYIAFWQNNCMFNQISVHTNAVLASISSSY
jgi:hypothetical protein